MDFKRLWYSFRMLTLRTGNQRTKYLKDRGVFAGIGEDVMIQSRKIPLYPKLIRFGNNVRVASNVSFVTHDVIHNMLNRMPQNAGGVFREKIGCIEIGDNVFIGTNSTILYDVRIGSNVIIAAGSVVTKDIPNGVVVGGVPAKVIGTFDKFLVKCGTESEKDGSTFQTEALTQKVIEEEWNRFYERRIAGK